MANTTDFPHTLQMLDELTEIAEVARVANDGVPFTYVSPLPEDIRESAANTCFYVHDGDTEDAKPGCIFGVWLHTVQDVSLDELAEFEGTGVRAFIDRFAVVDDLTVDIADYIQDRQDGGSSWTDAVADGRVFFETRAARW